MLVEKRLFHVFDFLGYVLEERMLQRVRCRYPLCGVALQHFVQQVDALVVILKFGDQLLQRLARVLVKLLGLRVQNECGGTSIQKISVTLYSGKSFISGHSSMSGVPRPLKILFS